MTNKKETYQTRKSDFVQNSLVPGGADTVTRVWQLAEPLCTSEGMELVHIEYQSETGGQTLRLYIDKDGGITLDDCVYISRQISDLLDVSADDLPPYHLEVSSPGVDRPLGRINDFEKFKGNNVSIKTIRSLDGQRNFKGILKGVIDERVSIEMEHKTVSIPFKEIVKARLIAV